MKRSFSPADLPSLRVIYFGTYRANYSRNEIMIESLRQNGVEVIECHETLWYGIEDRVQMASGGWKNPRFWFRTFRAYIRLINRYFHIKDYDVLVIGYPGQFDVYLARILSRLKKRPLVWDVFMSVFLIAKERGLDKKSPFTARMLFLLEKQALQLPDLLIQDTSIYVDWLCSIYQLSATRFRLVPTGADNRRFLPRNSKQEQGNCFHVVYYGTYIPNHGVQVMIEAAALLSEKTIACFTFIGSGPEKEKIRQRADQLGLNRVRFIDWMDKDELVDYISSADLCLGAFGETPQSLMTVQNKIYECLAMRKAVVTGDSPAVRQVFSHSRHLFICDRNPQALAEAISFLYSKPDLRARMAQQGYDLFCEKFSIAKLGEQYSQHLHEINSHFIHKISKKTFAL